MRRPQPNNFMHRLNKTISLVIFTAIIFAGSLLLVNSAWAQVDELVVEYWSETESKWLPLQGSIFSETNFLPSESVTRLVKVTNYSNLPQLIAIQAINVSNPTININSPARLGDVLTLEIKENGIRRYKNDLSRFFSAGEVTLSDSKLAGYGAHTQYDFIVSFYSGSQNTFQGKSLGFDILIGFQGEEGGILPGAGSTGGGGGTSGGLPPGLTIQNETTASTTEYSVVITWSTSYPATSQVIYAQEGEPHTLDLTDNAGAPPKYGYASTTPESDVSPKVKDHTVTITGLTPNTKYYYRAVSHGSLAISREYSFTTLGAEIPQETPTEKEIFGAQPPEEVGILEEIGNIPEKRGEKINGIIEKEITASEETAPSIETPQRVLASLFATISSAWEGITRSTLLTVIVILCLMGLVFIGIREWRLFREKRKK